jgi:hypothetical protein
MLDRNHIPGSFTSGRDGSWNEGEGDERARWFRGGRRGGTRAVITCVVVLGLAGGALALAGRGSGDDGPSCPVFKPAAPDARGGATVDDRSMVPPPDQPEWLGLPGTEPFDLSTYPPSFEWGFGESFNSSLRFVEGDEDRGWPIGVAVQRGALDTMPGSWTSTEVQGRPALAGAAAGSATVRFEAAEGWVATVYGTGDDPRQGSEGFDEALREVRATADEVVPLGADHWVPIVDQMMQDLGGLGAACYRLGLRPGDGGTFVTAIGPPQVDATLTVAGAPTNAFQLVSTRSLETVPGGAPVEVRGRDGSHVVVGDAQLLVWNEGDAQHRLHFPVGVPVDEAVSLANRLVVLDDQAWADAVFPTSVPADLEAADWSRDARLLDGDG